MEEGKDIRTLAGGEVLVWEDSGASIFLKLMNKYGDPVDLNCEQARELARVLNELADSIE